MLYFENLEDIIFHRHEMFTADELIVVSGYVGPKPIERLHELPFNSRVIYGMYGQDNIQPILHNSLVTLQNSIENINIFYSNVPVHAKCYVWRNSGQIVYALIGSANFSRNGLNTPYKEVLAETTRDTFTPLNNYIQRILNNSISCLEIGIEEIAVPIVQPICLLSLLGKSGEVQNSGGLNWGYFANGQPSPKRKINDAYIKIRVQDILQFPELFPPKQAYPTRPDGRGRLQRHNDTIEMLWDDGIIMEGLFEQSQPINGVIYPKAISSFPNKEELGIYLRRRLRVPLGQPVRRHHLDRYGRTEVGVSIISEGVYKFDFSP